MMYQLLRTCAAVLYFYNHLPCVAISVTLIIEVVEMVKMTIYRLQTSTNVKLAFPCTSKTVRGNIKIFYQ
jgi:hypothetical protein